MLNAFPTVSLIPGGVTVLKVYTVAVADPGFVKGWF